MADISVQFTNKLNGYDKNEVDEFVKAAEAKLQEKAVELSELQSQVAILENRLNKLVGKDLSVEAKVEAYDKLMKKMEGDYKNLLTPAIAKAKAIEDKAQKEYQIRIDQARYVAEGIYKEAAERIAVVVDENMSRVCVLLGEYLQSKTLAGRLKSLVSGCKSTGVKVVCVTKKTYDKAAVATKKTYAKAKDRIVNGKKDVKVVRLIETAAEE